MKKIIYAGFTILLIVFSVNTSVYAIPRFFPIRAELNESASSGASGEDRNQESNKEDRDFRLNLKPTGKALKNVQARIADGTVTGKSSSSLTVSKNGKTYTVNVDANTMYRRHFWGKSSFAEISVNDHVNVWGKFTDDANTVILARLIRDTSIAKRFGVFFGQITSINGSNFVMQAVVRGTQTVTVDSNTKFKNRKEQTIALGDLQVGHKVRVRGMWDKTNNTITQVTEVKDFSLPPQGSSTPTPTP